MIMFVFIFFRIVSSCYNDQTKLPLAFKNIHAYNVYIYMHIYFSSDSFVFLIKKSCLEEEKARGSFIDVFKH